MKKTKKKSDVIEFVLMDEAPSSATVIAPEESTISPPTVTLEPSAKLEDMPPVFQELAEPKLPELRHENRARLQMQSPNRLYFYWSVGPNPFHKLNKALGAQTANYTLVLKLVDLKRDTEQIHRVEAEGSSWFEVEADGEYRAEIGFYSPSRPYVRALFSNTVSTPRKRPSPRIDTESDWSVSADRFVRVLEVAGFSEDAFDVALAGDDVDSANAATLAAFNDLVGDDALDLRSIGADEVRNVLLFLAAGATLESLRWKTSPALFAMLQERSAALSAEKALGVLKERFDIEADVVTSEEFGPAVFGASSINFPRRLTTRRALPKLAPVSSPTRPN